LNAPQQLASNVTPANDETLDMLLRLRIAVAYLGEKEQFAWWTTQFLSAAGLRFLQFTYPRSAFAAGVNAATETAKAFHDRRIGKGGVSHLFRFPYTIEQRMSASLLSRSDGTLNSIVSSKQAAIDVLDGLKNDYTKVTEGPVRVGSNRLLSSKAAASGLAAFYSGAFQSGKQTLPYFTVENE
jgi:hypothetical protein